MITTTLENLFAMTTAAAVATAAAHAMTEELAIVVQNN
jgi:hypothetical protein